MEGLKVSGSILAYPIGTQESKPPNCLHSSAPLLHGQDEQQEEQEGQVGQEVAQP